jgi:DNA-binding Lrp family transcriptional regulator
MDETDITILMVLLGNSRTPYQEIADMLNMSVNSIHKRIKNLVKLGIIRKFITKINLPYNNVLLYGSSKAKNIDDVFQKLGNHENIYNVTQASNNYLIVHANIVELRDLDPIVSFVRKIGEIAELTVGLDKIREQIKGKDLWYWDIASDKNTSDQQEIPKSELHYYIINSIKENSRKTISDIADEIGLSTKTVRRRLNQIIENKMVLFTVDFYPDKSGDTFSYLIVKLNPNTNTTKEQLVEKLREQFGPKILFPWTFSNLPNEMILLLWTRAMKELQEVESYTTQMSNIIDSVKIVIGYHGENFYSLRDKFLDDKLKELID